MNIVRISAGLGNQMFQYAFYMALQAVGNDTVGIDISEFRYRNHHNGYELSRIFGVEAPVIPEKEVAEWADTSKSLWACIRRDKLGIRRKVKGVVVSEPSIAYYPEFLQLKDTYFNGFWQSWRYFENIEDKVRSTFVFRPQLSPGNSSLAAQIEGSESVAMHVRRGDYTKSRRWKEIGSICSRDYYGWAIASIHQQLGNDVQFFIFSDDIEWVRRNIPVENAVFVEGNRGSEAYVDMQLMSMCKHNIIANSSFSWWGAWLNNNPDKIVIAPEKWYRSTPTPDMIPPYWITLPID